VPWPTAVRCQRQAVVHPPVCAGGRQASPFRPLV